MPTDHAYHYSVVDIEYVVENIDEYIIPENQAACKLLWSKNIFTIMSNNYENEHYGVGISYGKSPWGPFAKYQNNPIIHQIEEQHIYSTGHGSYINIDGKDYYIFHMRDSKEADRCIAWCELYISNSKGISISPIHKCELINH